MKELMSQRPFAEITVNDICEGCGLNRKSLYYHFEDKYDLVNWIFQSEFAQPLEKRGVEDFWVLFAELAEYLYKDRVFYCNAFKIQGENRYWEYLSQYLQPFIFKSLKISFRDGHFYKAQEKQNAYAEFLADSAVHSFEKWLAASPCLPPEKYIDLLKP